MAETLYHRRTRVHHLSTSECNNSFRLVIQVDSGICCVCPVILFLHSQFQEKNDGMACKGCLKSIHASLGCVAPRGTMALGYSRRFMTGQWVLQVAAPTQDLRSVSFRERCPSSAGYPVHNGIKSRSNSEPDPGYPGRKIGGIGEGGKCSH